MGRLPGKYGTFGGNRMIEIAVSPAGEELRPFSAPLPWGGSIAKGDSGNEFE